MSPADTPSGPDAARRLLSAAGAVGTLLAGQPAAGQIVQLTGYYENTLQADYASETKVQLLDASKVRVDFDGFITDGLDLNGNVNFILSLGATDRHLNPYLPRSVMDELEAAGVPDTFSLDRARLYVDNLFVTWTPGAMRIRAGKQQLSWGPGYSFNPTDLFHRKNLVDPTYEKEGVTAFRLDYQWGVGGQLTLISAPQKDDLDETGYALRVGTHVADLGYDVAVTLHQVWDSTALDPATLLPYTQRRRAVGVDLSGELLGLGVWLEGNYNWMERESGFTRVTVGADYTLDNGTYLVAEALYSGRATSHSPYPAHDWLANVFYGEPIGRGWLMTGVRHDVSALVLGSGYLFLSPDGSVLVNPRVDVSLAQDVDLVVFGGVTFGDEEGAFQPGLASLVARGTFYF
jgi:hypothetical protein